jgi:hypothetical protein
VKKRQREGERRETEVFGGERNRRKRDACNIYLS